MPDSKSSKQEQDDTRERDQYWQTAVQIEGQRKLIEFLDLLKGELQKVQAAGSELSVCLLLLPGVEPIYPFEQSRKSLMRELVEVMREEAGVTGTIMPWGYEQIGVIFDDMPVDEALLQARQALAAIDRHKFQGPAPHLVASTGFSAYPADGITAEELTLKALEALDQARLKGEPCLIAAGQYQMPNPQHGG